MLWLPVHFSVEDKWFRKIEVQILIKIFSQILLTYRLNFILLKIYFAKVEGLKKT